MTDYRAIHEAQDRRKAEAWAQAQAVLSSMVEHLPVEGWSLVPDDARGLPRLQHTSGANVWFRPDWSKPERLDIHGVYEATSGGYTRPKDVDGPDSITLSVTREPKAFARDLARRFLVPYLAAYLRSVGMRDEDRAQIKAQAALRDELGEVMGTAPPKPDAACVDIPSRVVGAHGRFTVSYGGSSVRVDLDVSPRLALAIAAVVAGAPLTPRRTARV